MVTAIVWFLVVFALGIGSNQDNDNRIDHGHPASYPYWMVSFSGPIALATAFAHAAFSRKPFSSIARAIVSLLNVVHEIHYRHNYKTTMFIMQCTAHPCN